MGFRSKPEATSPRWHAGWSDLALQVPSTQMEFLLALVLL